MSIASRITEIETHINNAYTSIDNLGIDISNTNKNIYNISALLDTFYESLPKVSGIGASLSLSPTMVGKIKLNEIQGNTLQENTPTPDTPVEIQSVTGLQNINVCGKNLFDKDSGFINAYIDTSGVIHDNVNSNALFTYIKVQSNTTYTFSCNTSLRNLGINEFNSSKTFISRTQSQNVGSLTITTSSTTNYLRLQINYDNTTSITQAIIDSLNLQLEQGSATTYEPYKGNTYEVNLGKNLFDSDLIIPNIISKAGRPNAFSYDSSTKELTMTNYSVDTYLPGIWSDANYIEGINIKVHPNTTYTLSFDINQPKSTLRNGIMGLNKQTNKYRYISNGLMKENLFTFNTGEYDTITIRLGSTAETGTVTIFSNFQLERGETQTSYSPYFTPIELNKIGDYQDRIYKDNGKWYIEKNIGEVVLNGTESWETQWNGDNIHGWRTTIPNLKQTTGGSQSSYAISNNYETRTQDENFSTGNYGISNRANQSQIIIKNNDITSQNDFTTWLGTHNTQVNYILSTSTYATITNTELINQLESLNNAKSEDGITNINVTSEDLSMILNVGVLKGE